MPTPISIFADLTNRQLVFSDKSSQPKRIDQPNPPFHQDILQLAIQPMQINPAGGERAPYTLDDAAGYSVTVLIVKASDGSTLVGPMNSWTVDGLRKVGSLEFNTAAMAAAFTSASTVSAVIEIQFLDGANGKTTIQQAMTINKAYIVAGVPGELPLASYLTRDEVLAMFVRFSGNPDGASITLQNGVHQVELKCNADGTFGADAV